MASYRAAVALTKLSLPYDAKQIFALPMGMGGGNSGYA